MSRKTAIRITNEETRLVEAREDARKDKPRRPIIGIDNVLGLPTAAMRRERLAMMEPDFLLRQTRRAARLELRGAMYSSDDRADAAAAIVAAVLAETHGAMPRVDSPRVAIGRLCGDAKNLRRSIDATRELDTAAKHAADLDYAESDDALGIDTTPAKAAAIIARSGAELAARAATAVCLELQLPADEDSPHWSVLYQWARDRTGEQCAAERGVSWHGWKMRAGRGAKFMRGYYGAAELLARLTLGAAAEDGAIVYVREDASKEAHGRTPIMAEPAAGRAHWREGTDNGRRPEKPLDAAQARATCKLSRQPVRPKRERERAKGSQEAQLVHTADALGRIGREYMRQAKGRGKASARHSALEPIAS